MNISIRKLKIEDILSLQQISRQTFHESFSEQNTEGNMAEYLENDLSIKRLSSEIQNINSEFYFAFIEEKIIGYFKMNVGLSQAEFQDDQAIELERIYLLKEFQGKGYGQLIFEKVLQIAKKKKATSIWLGVWEENVRAINFYKRNGFVEFGKHLFLLGKDEQTDCLMRMNL